MMRKKIKSKIKIKIKIILDEAVAQISIQSQLIDKVIQQLQDGTKYN